MSHIISVMMAKPHVLWFDNFAKYYKTNVHLVRNETGMKYCLWSAEGISPYTCESEPVSLSMGGDDDDPGEFVNGMPSIDDFKVYMHSVRKHLIQVIDTEGPGLFSTAEVTKRGVASAPPTLKKSKYHFMQLTNNDEVVATRMYREQFSHLSYMEGFYPKNLVRLNSGANADLLKWLSRIHNRMSTEYNGKYLPLKVDCNIFNRILKVSRYLGLNYF
jgi:hypothetical protein